MSARERGGALLFRGQRKSRKARECSDCFRPICKGEFYWSRVELLIDPEGRRSVLVSVSCCREV